MNKDLDLYLKHTFRLARTLVIKSVDIADTMNNALMLAYGSDIVDETDPTTWKYYVNLSGEHHSYTSPDTGNTYITDQQMFITSLDDGTNIEFKKSVLYSHPYTLKEYRKMEGYYNQLVKKYPEQILLINGILFPVDIQKAIDAENFKILSYNKDLVEDQEDSLIRELNDWIYRYQDRWNVRAFKITDNLYQAAQLATLYSAIVPKILNLRLKRCLTYEAHSFHIRNFLTSHYKIGQYIEKLNNKEILWLYKNIRYVERRIGKYDTIKLIGEKLLKPFDIGLYKLDIIQNEFKRLSGSPDFTIKRLTINNVENDTSNNNYTLEQTLEKETDDPLIGGIYGKEFSIANYPIIDEKIELSNYSSLNTKMIESKLLDYGDISPLKRLQIIIDNWVYLSNKNDYTAITTFVDPNTGEQHLLTQYQSVLLFIYFLSAKIGIKDPVIPIWRVAGVTRDYVDTVKLSQVTIEDTGLAPIVNEVLLSFPEKPLLNSIEDFEEYTLNVYRYYFKQWVMCANTHDIHNTAYLKSIYDRTFLRTKVAFRDSGRLFSDWLNDNNLNITIDDSYDLEASIKKLVELNTGFIVSDISELETILRSIMKIFNTLLAYTTQNVTEFNKKPLAILNQNYLRPSKNPIGVIEQPDLIFKCMYDLDIELTMSCNGTMTPVLEVLCGDEYLPDVNLDCSLQNSPDEITIDCSLHRAPINPYLDCTLPTPPQNIEIACGGVTTPLISINDLLTFGPNIITGSSNNVGDQNVTRYYSVNSNVPIGVYKYGIDPTEAPNAMSTMYTTIHGTIPVTVIDEEASLFGLGPLASGKLEDINSNINIQIIELNK